MTAGVAQLDHMSTTQETASYILVDAESKPLASLELANSKSVLTMQVAEALVQPTQSASCIWRG